MTTATVPVPTPVSMATARPRAVMSEQALETLLHDLAEEAVDQRWDEKGERAGDLVLRATTALREGLLESAQRLAELAGDLLGSPLTRAHAA